MSLFIESFSYDYFLYAFVAALILGVTAPLIGVFVIQKNLSFASDSLGHIGIAGAGIGLATNSAPILVSIGLVMVGALLIFEVQQRFKASGDYALAVVSFTGISIGLIFSSKSGGSSSFESLLFGSLLTITKQELIVITIVCLVLVGLLYRLKNVLFSITVDTISAQISGIPINAIQRFFYIALATIILIGMKTVGVLLVGALIVIPAGCGLILAKSLNSSLVYASLFGAIGAVTGMYVSTVFDFVPGATIVVCLTSLLAIVKVFSGVSLRR
jgi:zinc transport system permease protein